MKYKDAHDLYIELYEDGIPKHKLATTIATTLDIPIFKVRRWAREGDWIDKNNNNKEV